MGAMGYRVHGHGPALNPDGGRRIEGFTYYFSASPLYGHLIVSN
jgi:hypothetical protein